MEIIMQLLKLPPLFLALAIAACGGGGAKSSPATTPATATAERSDPSCPVAVPGTSVTVEDASAGAALVFVTTGDVTELRRRVSTMASMHNDHHGSMGPLPDGKEGVGGHAGHDMGGHAGHDLSGQGSGGHAGHDMSGSKHAGHAGGMIGVHSKAEASDVEGGAKMAMSRRLLNLGGGRGDHYAAFVRVATAGVEFS